MLRRAALARRLPRALSTVLLLLAGSVTKPASGETFSWFLTGTPPIAVPGQDIAYQFTATNAQPADGANFTFCHQSAPDLVCSPATEAACGGTILTATPLSGCTRYLGDSTHGDGVLYSSSASLPPGSTCEVTFTCHVAVTTTLSFLPFRVSTHANNEASNDVYNFHWLSSHVSSGTGATFAFNLPSCVSPGQTATFAISETATAPILGPQVFAAFSDGVTPSGLTATPANGAPAMGSFTVFSSFFPNNTGTAAATSTTETQPANSKETIAGTLGVETSYPFGWINVQGLVANGSSSTTVAAKATTIPVAPPGQTCNTPPPTTPTIAKKVVDPTDWFLGELGGANNLTAYQNDIVCYEITWRGAASSITDSLPRDFAVESCTPSDRRAFYCHYDPSTSDLFVHEQSGLPFSPSGGKVTVCGRFTRTHPDGVFNIAVLNAPNGTRYDSNPATVTVNPLPSGLTPPQLPPASVVTPATSPTTLNAPVQRRSALGASSAASFSWLASDVDAVPAALGPTFSKTFAVPGQYTVTELETLNGFTASRDVPVTVTAAAAGCHADADTLCLGANGRFRVQVDWQDLPNQHTGVASAHPITADTGAFWFFDSSNLELVVKVLDGTALNHYFWVFYGALSNVQYEIKVTDTQTGTVRTYTNPQGTQASASDTSAFPSTTADGTPPSGEDGAAAGLTATTGDSIACTTGGNNLCLDGRFLVNVAWSDAPSHRSGSGTAVALTSTSGYEWFFADTNVELILKIVDGRGLNGHFWFFYGALSNVQYTITVTDTQTGARKTYNNTQGTQASQADTSAF